MKQSNAQLGIFYTATAYLIWGVLPIYWKLVDDVPAGQILAHRIIWSFLFMICIVTITRKSRAFLTEVRAIMTDRKKRAGITLAAVVISLNWLVYIWAVNAGHVVEASLGYYINPLVSIAMGVLFLKEKLSQVQILSFALAGVGVIYLTFSFGVFPWISFVLALSFALYGLLKKTVDISAMFGLTVETMIVFPIALIYLFALPNQSITFDWSLSTTNILLIGTGIATAVPLLLFAFGAKIIPMVTLGFLQYIAPTLMLIIGVFMYHEVFTTAHLIAFICIWTALMMYMGSIYATARKTRRQQ